MVSDAVTRYGVHPDKVESFVNCQLICASSLDWLGSLKRADSAVVFSVDDKTVPYWRKDLYPEYKGNRAKKEQFEYVKSRSLTVLERLSTKCFGVPSQESDDIIAGICRVKPADVTVTIATVDTDLLGLVLESDGERCGVNWFSLSDRWQPRYRDTLAVINEWALKRHSIILEKPSDIWAFKCQYGDASDNLPPGTPSYMIDLNNPHPAHDILNNAKALAEITSCFDVKAYRHPRVEEAANWLRRHGYRQTLATYS